MNGTVKLILIILMFIFPSVYAVIDGGFSLAEVIPVGAGLIFLGYHFFFSSRDEEEDEDDEK